ncbi:MAG: hypothetical protein GX131_02805 [candidate division WS1 bacterium]|nr:hypothetical protein [candidate division WS1 bacterium]
MYRLSCFAVASLILVATFALPADAQLPRLPRLEDIGGDILRGQIPGLDKILKEEPAISTSFDDAVFGVSLIDGFDPPVTAPMSQLPFTGDGGFIVALPGTYELAASSFCLHAGTHGPGEGEGYLWAPLKGAQAGIIQDVLDRYMMHPELDQSAVQSLIWGIQSKSKISDMPDELRDVAEVLLDDDQIRDLNGGALAIIPDELLNQAFVDVPPEVRMVLEAESRLRDRLRQEVFDFPALEQVAVLAGDPPAEAGGPVIPEGRWSFEPGGYFVRFDPSGYSETILQLYAPEQFRAVTDAVGRITSLTDRAGQTIELQYAAADPVIAAGDAAVAAHLLQSIRLLRPDGEAVEIVCVPGDFVLTGVPAGNGSFDGEANALYAQGETALADLRELAGHIDGASPDSPLVPNVMNLAHLARTLDRIAEREGAAVAGVRTIEALGHRAVASELALLLTGAESETAFRPVERETRLAMLPWATGSMIDVSAVTWQQRGRRLPVFRPSGGTGTPASRGRQRLGQSGRSREIPWYKPPARDSNRENGPQGRDAKGSYSDAKNGMDAIGKGQDAIEIIGGGPAGWAAGKIGMGIPNYLFGKILDFNFDAWGKASAALGGDPPVPNFDEIAMPEPIALPGFAPEQELSPEHTAAVQALTDTIARNLAVVRAANVTEDRLGGAMEAGNDEWTTRQAQVLVDYKRQAGLGMMEMAERIDDVLQALRNAGVDELIITPAAVEAYQQRLRTEGFDAQERQAAQILGITDEELDAMLAERIAGDPNALAGDLMESRAEFADALWWLGMGWSNLPAAEPAG